jgi:hypothetical protein
MSKHRRVEDMSEIWAKGYVDSGVVEVKEA